MSVLYIIAVWVHVLTVFVWIGAMVFEDPKSVRVASRLSDRLGGVGWYAQAVLWITGLFMLSYRGIHPAQLLSSELLATEWGRLLWAKIALVLLLLAFQIAFMRTSSKLVYGSLVVLTVIVAISVVLVRPTLLP